MSGKPNRTLDCVGLYCPKPVFRTRVEQDRMNVGEMFEVLADDPASQGRAVKALKFARA